MNTASITRSKNKFPNTNFRGLTVSTPLIMASQKEIARLFARGESPSAIPAGSNFSVVETPESDEFEAAILSYGWAVIFARKPNGDVVEMEGWKGYSASTSTQMGKARRAIKGEIGPAKYSAENRKPKQGGGISWRANQADAEPL